MPNYICKLDGMYFEWSTVVDAPVTHGMTLEEFTEYYRRKYGESAMRSPLSDGFAERMKRVEQTGTSSMVRGEDTAEAVTGFNRAGPRETKLSRSKLVKLLRGRGGKGGAK